MMDHNRGSAHLRAVSRNYEATGRGGVPAATYVLAADLLQMHVNEIVDLSEPQWDSARKLLELLLDRDLAPIVPKCASDVVRQECPVCKHPVSLHDGDPEFYPGCQHVYGSTAKGSGGVGGQMITSCGCTAVRADVTP